MVIPLQSFNLTHGAKLVISTGSVVDFGKGTDWDPAKVALVNAANTGGVFGGGVDRAICKAGGPSLKAARKALPLLKGKKCTRIEFGSCAVTAGDDFGTLLPHYVIHAVGPDYPTILGRSRDTTPVDALLFSAYQSSLNAAAQHSLEYVGFCLLSAGVFRGTCSLDHVLSIAVAAVADSAYLGLKEVHLIAFTKAEQTALLKAAATTLDTLEGLQTDAQSVRS